MRVVQVAPRYPPRVGGVEAHVAALATRLADRGHEVSVVAADRRPGDPARERRETAAGGTYELRRVRSLAPNESVHVAPGALPAVRRLARDADVVHAHNYHSLPLSLAVVAARSLDAGALAGSSPGIVVTPHYHGTGSTGLTDRLLWLYRPVGRRALARTDARLCVSEWARERLREDLGLDAEVVPNGLDVARFAAAAAESTPDAAAVQRDRPYLLSVGRLAPYKGVDHAIRALAELPGYDLLVAGDGEARTDLERVARDAGVADRVEFLGFVDDERLPDLYAGAAALLSLSTVEAYGLTVAESLASGTPCVVREAAALATWTDRADCVGVPADDASPATLAAAVRAAVDREAPSDPLPDWETVTDRIVAVYERHAR